VRPAACAVVGLRAASSASGVHLGMYRELTQGPTTIGAEERTVVPWNF
jgi:hypothetical protein